MSVYFYPDRERLFKEVEQCIVLNRLDNLMSFCNSCSFKDLKSMAVHECHECKVQQGIKIVSAKKKGRSFEGNQDGERSRGVRKVRQLAKLLIKVKTTAAFLSNAKKPVVRMENGKP